MAAAALASGTASAQQTFKVGIIGEFTGPFATAGEAYRQAYLAKNGDVVGGQKHLYGVLNSEF